MLDESGTPQKTYIYDAWGNTTAETGTLENSFKYAGEYEDAETGFYYLRNRYYDPQTGRFTQEDPIRDGDNWYIYCSNNPLRYIDPLGLADEIRYVNTSDGPLNMRVAPGTDSKIKGSIPRGAQVIVIGFRSTRMFNGYWWTTVKYNGELGFVAESYLSSNPVIAATGNNSADSRRALPPEGTPNSKDTLYNPDGTPKQERYYPDTGDVRTGEGGYDDDYNHAGDGHGIGFPHRHPWENGERSKDPIPVPTEASSGWGAVAVVGVVTVIELLSYLYGTPVDLPGN